MNAATTIAATTIVQVALGERSYQIQIGQRLLATCHEWVAGCTPCTHAVVITDTNVAPHADLVVGCLEQSGVRVNLAIVPAGEPTKSVSKADELWRLLLEFGADRKSVVVAVGGGVIGDLAGFVAASFARGLPFLQIPTTLLAAVDSSVGGKVGVNLPGAKNMVGAFWQPRGVLIDPEVLQTLPEREYRSGLAEVVKYGVILDAAFFELLEQQVEALRRRDPQVLRQVIARCCRLKADVVEQDEREETGLRAVLNYGHTFAHALEAITDYGEYLHGEAVAIGMIGASKLAELLGRIDSQITARQVRLLTELGLPVAFPDLSAAELLAAMQRDKKVEHGRLRFVLPNRLGHVELVSGVDAVLVRKALD
jgi:3-dehydroquinate synthase